MVLENASGSQDDFTETAPASDNDPYSSPSSDTKGQYAIDSSQFPKGLPVIGPLFGYSEKQYWEGVGRILAISTRTLKRQPTSEEATAFAYWHAKAFAVMSYSGPAGLVAGSYRCYTTADTFRFPFYQPPQAKFNPQVFPTASFARLTGNRAVMMWHGLRAAAYGSAGIFFSKIFFAGYATSVEGVGHLSDPRLHDYKEAVRKMGGKMQGPPPGRTAPTSPVSPASQQDDASPTGGSFYDDVGATEKATSMNAGPETPRPQPQPQTQQPQQRWPQRAPVQQQQPQPIEESPFSTFDDASPTSAPPPQPRTQQPSGSAWDRVRSGQNSSSPTDRSTNSSWPTSQEPRESAWDKQRTRTAPTSQNERNNGFGAVESVEESRYEKTMAQREFDAQVERERKGGNFDERRY